MIWDGAKWAPKWLVNRSWDGLWLGLPHDSVSLAKGQPQQTSGTSSGFARHPGANLAKPTWFSWTGSKVPKYTPTLCFRCLGSWRLTRTFSRWKPATGVPMMSMWQFKRMRTHLIILNTYHISSYVIYILHYITQTSVWVSMFGFLKGGNDWSIGGESFCSTRMRFHQESFWEWIPSPGIPSMAIHGQALADGWAPGTKRIGWLRLQSIPRYFHGFAKIEQQLKY